MPEAARFSLETDLIPAVLPHGCYGLVTDAEVIDIGTPERYARALNRGFRQDMGSESR